MRIYEFELLYVSRGICATHWNTNFPFTQVNIFHKKFFDLGHLSFNKNKTQTAVTNICLNCITFINLTFCMLLHASSEVIIIQLQINLN